jgi:glutamate dehydrogenase
VNNPATSNDAEDSDVGSRHGPPAGADWTAGLTAALGGIEAKVAADEFAQRVTAAYQEQTTVAQAAADLALLARMPEGPGGGGSAGGASEEEDWHAFAVSPAPREAGAGAFRLRRYGRRGIELSRLLPLVESFGLVVVEAVPHQIRALGRHRAAHIDDVGLRPAPGGSGNDFDLAADGPRLVAAVDAATSGASDVDSLNRLVLAAGLDWHEVVLLRAYRRYRRQTGVTLSDVQLDDPLVAWPDVTRNLIAYARARFTPNATGADAARATVLESLDAVSLLEEDQCLRAYLLLVDATVRTNWALRDANGQPRPTVVVKLDSAQVPGLTRPMPKIETWVHAPSVEAIHLRNGLIARGGIRWSDRPDDFRTEVLGLAEAQVKKNAIIVPTGAKGGFVVRRPHHGVVDGAANGITPDEVRAAYQVFIDSLFDVTDNVVDGAVLPPAGVVSYDGEDPYLVVAADRGTATFSDLANDISARHDFWLGDAFASGGSNGYDHKAMGITARGAWVAVRRHFHQLDIDVSRETIRVTGVGDMSGDVFGNGMLRSEAIALVAAFDHRHVFIDPDPDPARSFVERTRMAGLARSSWDDYDRSVLSSGGGVWPRDTKVIELSPEARRALGVTASELSPPEVISAILRAPVDLLFFGGIGTYIKGPAEADAEVGDHANDGLRVTADEVRARVIAEGGNLAITQQGRIRYSRRGGRINADFIDNAAGVATSDREVNLKILLTLAIGAGRIRPDERDAILAAAEPDVADAVLRQVDHSVAALNRAVPVSADELDAHESLLNRLEAEGTLDRVVECLPSQDEFALRRAAGAGLIRPELAVLLAYAKSDLVAAMEASPLARDGSLVAAVNGYFPASFRALGEDLPARHRLAPQLAATALAGELVDEMGIAWAHETAAELGRPVVDVAAAFWAARSVLGADQLWTAIEDAAERISAETEALMHRRVSAAVGALSRRYLATSARLDPGSLLAADQEVADLLECRGELEVRLSALDGATYVADAAGVARGAGLPLAAVLDAFVATDRAVAPGLIRQLEAVRPRSRWSAWQARALIDDLVAWRPRAVAAALAATTAAGADVSAADVSGAVAAWVASHAESFARVDHLIESLDPERDDVLSVAALLVRALVATA